MVTLDSNVPDSQALSWFRRLIAPCLGLAFLSLSAEAHAQIRMVSPNGLAYTETRSVAQYGGFTAVGAPQDGLDLNGDGVGDDYRGGVYLYEWGNLRLNFVSRAPEARNGFLGTEVRLSNTWLAASAPYYNVYGGNQSGAVLLAKKVGGSYGTALNYVVKDDRITILSGQMPIAVSDTHLVIGSPGGTTTNDAGAVFIFTYDATRNTWGAPVILTPSDGHADDLFGNSVAIDGNRLVVGAPEHDDDRSDANAGRGRAYVFERGASGWTQTFSYTGLDATAGARYGDKIDVHGDRIIVSAPFAAGQGMIQILERDGLAWRGRYTEYRSTVSVAIHGDKAVVGTSVYPREYHASDNRVRTYRLLNGAWSPYGGMLGKDPGDNLGGSVDIYNDQVAVSARGYDYNGRQSVGAAFLENFWGTSAGLVQ